MLRSRNLDWTERGQWHHQVQVGNLENHLPPIMWQILGQYWPLSRLIQTRTLLRKVKSTFKYVGKINPIVNTSMQRWCHLRLNLLIIWNTNNCIFVRYGYGHIHYVAASLKFVHQGGFRGFPSQSIFLLLDCRRHLDSHAKCPMMQGNRKWLNPEVLTKPGKFQRKGGKEWGALAGTLDWKTS